MASVGGTIQTGSTTGHFLAVSCPDGRAGQVGAGCRVLADAGEHDGVQEPAELAVTAAAEPVAYDAPPDASIEAKPASLGSDLRFKLVGFLREGGDAPDVAPRPFR